MLPGFAKTCPLRTSSRFKPRKRAPMLSPAIPWSNNLRNISTPVQVVFWSWLNPITSRSSPTLTIPCSTRPVTTVPRPAMEKVSSMLIKKSLSRMRSGSGMFSSTVSISSKTRSRPISGLFPSAAARADPRTIGISSPSYPYSLRSSRISISTSSNNSSSSTRSHLFIKTTRLGIPTCLANKMCSRVCGIGPSVAATTKIPPSIWAAPVIMFFT
mmetsp:Transcript_519/g.1120  ORF Transcript_519/g.1120 Transcript_519/m.1120 type:complete len:214 (+) Transcript_519:364-1005(+)